MEWWTHTNTALYVWVCFQRGCPLLSYGESNSLLTLLYISWLWLHVSSTFTIFKLWTFISQKNTLGKTLFNTCLVSLVILLQFFFPYASLISLSRWKWYIICKKTKNKQTRNWFTTEMFYLVSIKKTDYKLGNFECIISGVYTSKGSGYCGCLTHTARNL